MKKLFRIAFILVALGLLSAVLVWKFYVNKPHEDIENATPAYQMTAAEIWKQYTTDLKTADSMYTGKVIEITGNLSRTDTSDSLVYAVFVMEADSMFGDKSVRCEMLSKYNADLKSLPKDTRVKLKGFCTGFDQTDIKFNKCSRVK
jgi:hypothetical protein